MFRETLGSFSIKQLSFDSAADVHASGSMIRYMLKRNNYHNLQSHDEGLVLRPDGETQILFAQKVKGILSTDLWTNSISFNFDRANGSVMD